RPPPAGGTGGVPRQAPAEKQPRDDRVGVPHLARPQLVSAPDRAWHAANELQEATGHDKVVAQQLGAGDPLLGAGDDSIPPPTHLVAEHPPASHPATADRTLNEDPAC